jgi:hypothetical protein
MAAPGNQRSYQLRLCFAFHSLKMQQLAHAQPMRCELIVLQVKKLLQTEGLLPGGAAARRKTGVCVGGGVHQGPGCFWGGVFLFWGGGSKLHV